MTEKSHGFEIQFVQEGDEALLRLAAAIINSYAEQGIMLGVTVDRLQRIAAQGLLALAVTPENDVVGAAGITFEFPDEKKEFGSWAVKPDWIHSGVGKQLLQAVLEKNKDNTVIAFANHNSGPIFQKLGAGVLDQQNMHPDAFAPCESCKCQGKHALQPGQRCVDTIFDLTPLLETEK